MWYWKIFFHVQLNVFFRGCLGVVRYLYSTQIHPLWVKASFSMENLMV